MPDSTDDESFGLAGALTFVAPVGQGGAGPLYDPQAIADMEATQQLRVSLDLLAAKLSEKPEPCELLPVTRANVIALLNCLRGSLSENLRCRLSNTEDPVILLDHPAMTLLDELIRALKDLDNAKTHPLFDAPKTSKGASLTHADMAKRDALLAFVDDVKLLEGFSSRKDAEEWVARKMQDKLGRGHAPTADQIKEMRKTRRRQQRRAS